MICQICGHDFPDEMGGNLCPRCDDLLFEAREAEFERKNDNNENPEEWSDDDY